MIVRTLYNGIIGAMAAVSGVFILFIVFSVAAEVVMRCFFHRPLAWTVEISEYLLLYIAFLSAAWVLQRDGHVRLDFVIALFGPKTERAFRRVSDFLCAGTALVLMVFSALVTYEQFHLKIPVIKTLEIPKWMVIVPIPLGCLFLVLEFLRRIFTVGDED